MSYADFFARAVGSATARPFPYQSRLAEGSAWPSRLEIPTGLGKTLAIVVGWLYRRQHSASTTPRRLVYCLPMRVLVDQTRDVVTAVRDRLGLSTRVVVLMGGVDAEAGWDVQPEDDAIIIGTQDMLLSRALNRGYGMSRYRWPLQFGMLNSDCLWVIDEVQLVGVGVATTAQLQAFRRKLGVFGPTQTTWVSATLEESWLRTVDVEDGDVAGLERLEANDRADEIVARRIGAEKALARASSPMGDLKALAAEVLAAHRAGTRTLIIVNTVDRATELHRELGKKKPEATLALVHSRFRKPERDRQLQALIAAPGAAGTIAVCTQVIEAGVDVTSATLFTEAAPWASLVQRFGRCNRTGEDEKARVVLIELPEDKDAEKLARPYELEDVRMAQNHLRKLTDVGPASLPKIPMKLATGDVLRRTDLLDLFDTTRDLLGDDVDVSRFIREQDEQDVQLYWRAWSGPQPPREARRPHRDELCSAPLHVVAEWVKSQRKVWRFDPIEGEFVQVRTNQDRPRPGNVLLLHVNEGGYDPVRGLDKSHKGAVPLIDAPTPPSTASSDDEHDGDPDSQLGRWYLLSDHSQDVRAEALRITTALPLPAELTKAVVDAGEWHDAGKAHVVWQDAIKKLGDGAPAGAVAKSASGKGRIHYQRPGFRHELASALLALAHGEPDLVVYLIAAHHGKVRMILRPAPHERAAPEGRLFARGVWDGDELPEIDLGARHIPPTRLSLRCVRMGRDQDGQPSWLERMLQLREAHGPFRLAFLEALVKCADERASAGIAGERT